MSKTDRNSTDWLLPLRSQPHIKPKEVFASVKNIVLYHVRDTDGLKGKLTTQHGETRWILALNAWTYKCRRLIFKS